MADSFEEQGWVRLGVAGALTKEYCSDERQFLLHLSNLLAGAFAEQTEIKRRGLITKSIASVQVTLGDVAYLLEDPGRGPLRAVRMKIVRGITLKREEIPVEEWLEELGETLESQVQRSAKAREALGRVLGLS
jgi:hypothetical protein